MQAALLVLGLWLAFGVSHVGLTTRSVCEPLVARLGERGFMWFFSSVSWLFFTALVAGYSRVRFSGPSGLALANFSWGRMPSLVAITAGFVLMAGALAPSAYLDSPAAILSDGV